MRFFKLAAKGQSPANNVQQPPSVETSNIREQSMSVPKSQMMDKLYGEKTADRVYNRLEELDPVLNEEIQKIAYDHYWARPGLSIRDKSLITVTSLVAMHKEEQTRIHMNGFLNAGGTKDELVNLLAYLAITAGSSTSKKGFEAFKDVMKERGEPLASIDQMQKVFEKNVSEVKNGQKLLSSRDKAIVDLSFCVAVGDQYKTSETLKTFLNDSNNKMEDLKNVMIHLIVYCGFPAAMNGFAALRNVLD